MELCKTPGAIPSCCPLLPKDASPRRKIHPWCFTTVGIQSCKPSPAASVCRSHLDCVITFRGVTWGPCLLILVFLGTHMSWNRRLVVWGLPAFVSSLLLSCLETCAVLYRFSFLSVHYLLDFFAIIGTLRKKKLVLCFLQTFKGWEVAVAVMSLESMFRLIPLDAGLALQLCPQVSELLLLVRCFLS